MTNKSWNEKSQIIANRANEILYMGYIQ